MGKKKEQSGTLDLFSMAAPTASPTEDESRKKTKDKPVDTEQKVYCADCDHFQRDTSGISRTIDGEYFMGECAEGLHPDTPKKQFADKARKCDHYDKRRV